MNSRPNILLLFTDQQRHDALSGVEGSSVRTPNLDALAASGVRFSQACASTPVCVASRMSLITGHRAGRTRMPANQYLPGPVPELPTMMGLLNHAGYYTHGVGKMHFSGRHYGFQSLERMEECPEVRIDDHYLMYLKEHGVRTRYPHGLRDLLYYQPQTSMMPLEHSPNTWVADRSIAFMRDHARYRGTEPFFLWSSWIAPHPPFAPCEPYDTMYDPADMPLPVYADRPLATLSGSAWGHRGRLDGAHLDPERIKRIRALYYGQVTHVDDSVGRILAELDRLGLAENTVILFASDHGDMLGDHGLSQKNVPYEGSLRVPLLVRWPGRTEAGRVSDDPVGLTDILPTLVDELGLEYPRENGPLPGESLLARDGGGLASGREAFVVDYGSGAGRWISLRSRRYKYALWATGGLEELYDLSADPHETKNLAAKLPQISADFRRQALSWERQYGLEESFAGGDFRTYAQPEPPASVPRSVTLNAPRWPVNLPEDERETVESYAEYFTHAVAKETTLSPNKVSVELYKKRGGPSLDGTPWEDAWRSS